MLPGTYYLVRMLDGRIDVQGVVKELRSRGLLESIVKDAESEPNKAPEVELSTVEEEDKAEEAEPEQGAKTKKARKLIKDEERETGSVKWIIYKTYLKASYVHAHSSFDGSMTMFCRSYWTWAILMTIVLIVQLLGFTERYWIMVRFNMTHANKV